MSEPGKEIWLRAQQKQREATEEDRRLWEASLYLGLCAALQNKVLTVRGMLSGAHALLELWRIERDEEGKP